MFYHSGLRNKLFANLDEIKKAFMNADNIINPDQRELQSILYRMATTSNPRLAGLINTRRTALSSYNYNITNDTDNNIKTALNKVISQILHYSCNNSLYGAYVVELKWELINNVWSPKIINQFLPFELEKDTNNNMKIVLTDNNFNVTRTQLEYDQKYIIASDNMPFAGGSLRSLVYHEFLRQDTLKEWAQFNQKLKGLIQAKAENDEKIDASVALNTFMTNNYAVTNKETEFILNTMTDGKALESFGKFLDLLNNEMAIAILGQANTTELPKNSGSRAALQILNLVRSDIIFADMNKAKDIINNQLLLYYYQLNSNQSATESPFQFDFSYDADEDIEANSRLFENLSRIGIDVIKSELYTKLGLTMPLPTDEIITLKQPQNNIGL